MKISCHVFLSPFQDGSSHGRRTNCGSLSTAFIASAPASRRRPTIYNCGSVFVNTLSPTTESLGYDHANLKQANNIMITGHSCPSCHCHEHCLVLITSFLKEFFATSPNLLVFPPFFSNTVYEKCHHPSNSRNPQFPRLKQRAGCFGDDLPASATQGGNIKSSFSKRKSSQAGATCYIHRSLAITVGL